jgi:hypothetical protein
LFQVGSWSPIASLVRQAHIIKTTCKVLRPAMVSFVLEGGCLGGSSPPGEQLDRSGESFELGAPNTLKFAEFVVFAYQADGPMIDKNLARLSMARQPRGQIHSGANRGVLEMVGACYRAESPKPLATPTPRPTRSPSRCHRSIISLK